VVEAECPADHTMYVMALIAINEDIDKEVENLYNRIIATTEDEERTKFKEDLQDMKEVREQVEILITKVINLNSEEDLEKLKKAVKRGLAGSSSKLNNKLTTCKGSCQGPGGCDSCAADVLFDAMVKMDDYKNQINQSINAQADAAEDEKAALSADLMESVRSDAIKYITDINAKSTEIIKTKIEAGELEKCDQDKLDVYNRTKGPMWMLVNMTLQTDVERLETFVDAMSSNLEELKKQYCGAEPIPDGPRILDELNCDWEEYTQIENYLNRVDQIIQDALFKAQDEDAQVTALLGFVDVQELFDKRVKKLFENDLQCPDEVDTIKKQFMGQLNKCMFEFMNPKSRVKFENMTRLQRISCTKELRTAMETRRADLLAKELEKSLDEITDDGVTEA